MYCQLQLSAYVPIPLSIKRLNLVPGWLREALALWHFLFWIALSCILADWIGYWLGLTRVERIPYAGWTLEILGLTVVAFDLSKRLEIFGEASLTDRIKQWFRTFPLLRQDRVIAAGSAHLSLGGLTVSARLKGKISEDATTEEKVELLMSQFDQLDDRIHDLQLQTKTDIEDVKKEIAENIRRTQEDIEAARSQLVKAHVGDVGLEVAGLGWILIGITLATVPEFVLWIIDPVVSLLTMFGR